MTEPAWQARGAWRFLVAPGWDRPGFDATLAQLGFLVQKSAAPLAPPSRHRALLDLSYDDYRDIRFRPDRALWQDRPFELMFFHAGRGHDFHADG